jgi:hypothetical protein
VVASPAGAGDATSGEPDGIRTPSEKDYGLAVFEDPDELDRLAELKVDDPAGFAAEKVELRKRGTSLRDLDRALASRVETLHADRRELIATSDSMYDIASGAIHRTVPTEDGQTLIPLCNFDARIIAQTTRDDGAEQTKCFTIEGRRADGAILPAVEIRADEFATLSWVTTLWGNGPVIYAGMGTKDHLRTAIQMLSRGPAEQTVYGHTGWREIDGQWCYLHGGGAIGPTVMAPQIKVHLDGAAARFQLPPPPSGNKLRDAVRASLAILDGLAPDPIVFPFLATVYRAVLGSSDYSLWLAGPSGAQKSELAALAQQHFGASMIRTELPGNWTSTDNALEGLAFILKDALLVIDDFAPSSNRNDAERQHRAAERLIRGQGNHSGRQRMRADATLRPPKPPRGQILSTGEDLPRGHSITARLGVLDVSRGTVKLPRLSECQRDAANGMYASAMAGFLAWLAPRYAKVRGLLERERIELRDLFVGKYPHARTPDIIANLLIGLRYLLRFAESVGVINPRECQDLWNRGEAAFLHVADQQGEHQRAADPISRFPEILAAVISSGRGHVAGVDGKQPTAPPSLEAWGWECGSGMGAHRARGDKLGWVGEHLYLDPDSTYAALCEFVREQGQTYPITPQTLKRRLNEAGHLIRTEPDRTTYPEKIEGTRKRVLVLDRSFLFEKSGQSGQSGQVAINLEQTVPVSNPDFPQANPKPGQKTQANSLENTASVPVIPVIPVSEGEGGAGGSEYFQDDVEVFDP